MMKGLIYLLGIALLVANAVDMITTYIGISLGATELNPLYHMRPLLFFLIKVVLPLIIVSLGVISLKYFKSSANYVVLIFTMLTGIYLFCIINNIGVILRCLV